MHTLNSNKEGDISKYSRPPIISGTSACPHATQAIFGKGGATLLCLFFFLGGTTEKVGTSVTDFAATGFGAAGLRTRLGFVVSGCVGRIDFIAYGGISDCDRLANNKR
jgi:hypothetical protein